jgi:hypothetical protein
MITWEPPRGSTIRGVGGRTARSAMPGHPKMSSELTASQSPSPVVDDAGRCRACGSPLHADQRYCLECGERAVPVSSLLLGAGRLLAAESPLPTTPPALEAPLAAASASAGGRPGFAVTTLAGVGVLMLAMGVGVLIGRSGGSRPSAAAPQVVTVGAAPQTGSAGATGEVAFQSDWPTSKSGYTVRLQTLPESGTSTTAVAAAKGSATAKGAPAVGALRSRDFTSLTAGSYVIYSGVDATRAQALKALGALKRSFPGAAVIRVAKSAAGSAGAATESGGGKAGSSLNHPAPPSVLEGLKSTKGKSYEERSKALPNVVSTG